MYKQVTAAIDEPLRDRGCGDGLIALLRDMLHKEPSERPESWRDVYARSLDISDGLGAAAVQRPAGCHHRLLLPLLM